MKHYNNALDPDNHQTPLCGMSTRADSYTVDVEHVTCERCKKVLHPQTITLTLTLCPAEALALAQLVKRIGWSELRDNAVDDPEAWLMREAVEKVARALRDVGFDPR
jgi:hypothetical protein